MENIENKRRKKHDNIECVPVGFANGVAGDFPLTQEQKDVMIEEAAEHFGRFLTALKCDWQNDPNSISVLGFNGSTSYSLSAIFTVCFINIHPLICWRKCWKTQVKHQDLLLQVYQAPEIYFALLPLQYQGE